MRTLSNSEVTSALQRHGFAPEFLGRFEHVVTFDNLGLDVYTDIVRAELLKLSANPALSNPGLVVPAIPDGDVTASAEGSFDPALGARPAAAAARRLLEDALLAANRCWRPPEQHSSRAFGPTRRPGDYGATSSTTQLLNPTGIRERPPMPIDLTNIPAATAAAPTDQPEVVPRRPDRERPRRRPDQSAPHTRPTSRTCRPPPSWVQLPQRIEIDADHTIRMIPIGIIPMVNHSGGSWIMDTGRELLDIKTKQTGVKVALGVTPQTALIHYSRDPFGKASRRLSFLYRWSCTSCPRPTR